MSDAPSRWLPWQLGHDLGYAAVTIGQRTITDVDDWNASVSAATPDECRAWLQALAESLMQATPHSRARLEAWRRSPVHLPATEQSIRENLLFYGDLTMLDHVVAAFLCMPAPVREYVLGECAFEGVGADTAAWLGSSTLIDQNGNGRPQSARLCGADRHLAVLKRTVLHEAAHCWTVPRPTLLITALGEAGLKSYALKHAAFAGQLDAKDAFDERIAGAFAALWDASGVEGS